MDMEDIRALRQALHRCPERSGQEERTRAALMDFLARRTTLELRPCGAGFYAAHREPGGTRPPVALRADYDALALPGGGAAHLCGHDGHAAALCAAALSVQGERLDRDAFFLFQPAEETGAGAPGCLELFDRERVAQIYGAHNLPGLPLGQVVTRPGTFACASRGVTITFLGRPTHAAYPEHGLSPAPAVGRLLCALPELAAPTGFGGMTLCTVIGAEMGERAFGTAAARAEIWLTLRAERDQDLERLFDGLLRLSQSLASEYALGLEYQVQERGLWPLPAPLPRRVLRHRRGGGLSAPPHPALPVPGRPAGAHRRRLPRPAAGLSPSPTRKKTPPQATDACGGASCV